MEADRFVCQALFSTLTNVNFDPDDFVALIKETAERREALKAQCGGAGFSSDAATFTPAEGLDALTAQGREHGIKPGDDATSLRHIILFGLRGVAAYADHAAILGQEDPEVYSFITETLAGMDGPGHDAGSLTGLALKVGEVNLRAMELLDAGNTGTYGHPVPTTVPLGHKAGKAILVSGHDLKDLAMLLEQSQGKGITVYTHGEMLPTPTGIPS